MAEFLRRDVLLLQFVWITPSRIARELVWTNNSGTNKYRAYLKLVVQLNTSPVMVSADAPIVAAAVLFRGICIE